ncbi:MAG: protoporphyrinogen oxidase [Candidatus Dadabacteria bacterium]|nr:protoporphyrinogen oxidase [Candidatus Dadabacteria bacterium]
MSTRKKIIVVGGGISGLSAAHKLVELREERGLSVDITLLEAGPRVGGVISTRYEDGFIIEEGPDSFITTKPAALQLCSRIGLGDSIIPTNQHNRRTYILLDGKLLPLPDGFLLLAPTRFWPFIKSPVFSLAGKLRMIMEVVIPRRAADEDESLGSFVRRRFGAEALERVAQPLIGGIYASDPEKLSVKATMPRFLEMERQSGSVIRALLREQRASNQSGAEGSGARYGLIVSLRSGMQSLVDGLASRLPEGAVKLGTRVKSVEMASGRWIVSLDEGEGMEADGLIIAAPSFVASRLLEGLDSELSNDLGGIEYASSAVVNFGFNKSDIKQPLDGFGIVVPAVEKRAIIACSFSSVKFEGRAPEGKHLIRCFLGGALNPGVCDMDERDLSESAFNELRYILGGSFDPLFSYVSRYPSSMPQYMVGHLDLISEINGRVSEHSGLELAGNYFDGVGTPDCIRTGETAAENLLDYLFSG